MLPKYGVVFDSYDVVNVVRVVLFQKHQNFEFYSCLMVESFLVSDDFDSHELVCFIIVAFQGLAETAFAQEF